MESLDDWRFSTVDRPLASRPQTSYPSAMRPLPPMLLVVLLWCAGLGAAAQFGKISILYEDLRATYGGNGEVALGLVVSIVGMVGLIFGTTAGLLVARIGPRRAIVTALAAGAAMSALQSLMPAYPLMLASRIIEGASHLAIVVVGPTMIAALAPEHRRPLAMTLWSSFFGVTYTILALIGPHASPTGLFLGHASYMAALAAILALTLPPDPRGQALPMGNLLAQHAAIYLSPRLAAPAMGFCCYTFLYVAILTLLPPETPETHRALIAAGMPLVSIAVSLTLGVRLLGRMTAVRLVQTGYAVAIPGFLILWLFWGISFELPAWLVILEYFVVNLLNAWFSVGRQGGGVAFFAHLGGFVAGLLLVRLFMIGRSGRDHDRWDRFLPPGRSRAARPRRHDPW